MSTQSASVQSITHKDNQPVWDFAAVTAFPIELQQRNSRPVVYAYMTPYQPSELRDVLKRAVSGYRREKRDVEIVREDRNVYVPLFDSHFVRFGKAFKKVKDKKVPTTPDDDKAFLAKYPEIKSQIVEHTFGGLRMDPPKTADDTDDILDISLELSGSVHVYQDLYDETTDKIVRVDMLHEHAHPTEVQYREYRGARRSKFIQRSALWTISEQHATLEKLYDAVIQSISGAAANGVLCDLDHKNEWLPFVPLWHKLWIVDHIFAELVEKNA